jgi:hypothetical protein
MSTPRSPRVGLNRGTASKSRFTPAFALLCLTSACGGGELVDVHGATVKPTFDTSQGPPPDTPETPSLPTAFLVANCDVDADCIAPVPCVSGVCIKHRCSAKILPEGSTCDDGIACTHGDLCEAGQCHGIATVCSDGNTCTEDTCDGQGGCTHTAVDKPCEGNSTCDLYTCQQGACTAVGPLSCDDGNPCTVDTCTQGTGCLFKGVDGIACDDGNPCTTADSCVFGQCSGMGEVCSDGNPCTDDSCAPGGGCVHVPSTKLCSDGDFCTSWDQCQGGVCKGSVKSCEDGDPCTTEACDPKNGQCLQKVIADGTDCDDDNACTTATLCHAGICLGSWKPCDDGDPCTIDSCDGASGGCQFTVMVSCVQK